MRYGLTAVLCITLVSTALAQDWPDTYARWNLPIWAQQVMNENAHLQQYQLFLGLNPFYVSGDFDGDNERDVAIQVVDKATGKRGVIILHRDGRVHVLGAGQRIGNGGDDFSWLWVWRTESPDLLPNEPVRGHDVLYVAKPEAAGGLIWWDGERYRWTQWGD